MKSLFKTSLPLATLLLISGCTVPGSHLPTSDKQVINTDIDESQMSEEELANTPVEVVNVYPLTPSFVADYGAFSAYSNTAQTNPALDAEIANYQYYIGPGDILNITVWDHPELTIPAGSYRSAEEAGHWVHADGKIYYPYVGFLKVAGKTVTEIRNEITVKLARYIESPQVDVNIAAFRSQKTYVTGEVDSPGQQEISNVPRTLLDAINEAGGLETDADWRNVTITRNGKTDVVSLFGLMLKGDLTQNRLLLKGDIVHVPRNDAQKVFVLGDVNSPAVVKIDRAGMTLTEALSAVGGINELAANATGVFVVRSSIRDKENESYLTEVRERQKEQSSENNERPETPIANIYQLDISDATALVTGTEFELEPYDVVYVTAAPIVRWNRVMAQLLPTVDAINKVSETALNLRQW